MPKGKGWLWPELAHLAEAWSKGSDDPARFIDQNSSTIWKAVVSSFSALDPKDPTSQGKYAACLGVLADRKCAKNPGALKRKMRIMSADVQHFHKSLRKVILSEPTCGVFKEQIHAMAIEIQSPKTKKIDNAFIDDNCRLE